MSLTVLVNAGPWLPVPPRDYGGIEAVVASLVPELRRRGVRVVLATVEESTLPAERYVTVFASGQFAQIAAPYNRTMGIAHAHMQDVAARACRDRGIELLLAGPVAGAREPRELDAELADPSNPLHQNGDVEFYLRRVRPLEGPDMRWIGAVSGTRKRELIARARALLCPVRWEEPGGTAVIEALASGTPVIGFRRGCLPMLVEHGVTGFLADDEDELARYLDRVDELDPLACREAAVGSFSSGRMAERYIDLYAEVLRRVGGARAPYEPTSNTV